MRVIESEGAQIDTRRMFCLLFPYLVAVTAVALNSGVAWATETPFQQGTQADESTKPDDSGPRAGATSDAAAPEVETTTTETGKPIWPKPDLFRLRPTRMMAELGVYTGIFVVSESHEIYNYNQEWQRYRPGVVMGVRGGFYPLTFLGVEAEGGVAPLRTDNGDRATLYTVRGHAVFQLPLYSVVPFALAGAGGLGTTGGLGSDIDPAIHFGGGAKMFMNRWFGFRVEGRGIAMPARTLEGGYTMHGELLFNVVVTLNRRYNDNDGDGFPDPGQRSSRVDACPMTPGVAALRGCPDFDSDGLTDGEDLCPREHGPKARKGCPGLLDSDGDGYFDPRQYNIPEGKEDRCPGLPGVLEYMGCPVPDTDEDGFDDLHDKCIEEAENINGYEDEDGCPDDIPPQVLKILGTIKGINFGFLSATLTDESKPRIARIAKVLTKYPSIKLQIQGHTDSDGDPAFNQDLSSKRAESVRKEMIRSGLKESQVTAVGYGGDKPIASNETEGGRAQNRRIEFKLLDRNGLVIEADEGKNR